MNLFVVPTSIKLNIVESQMINMVRHVDNNSQCVLLFQESTIYDEIDSTSFNFSIKCSAILSFIRERQENLKYVYVRAFTDFFKVYTLKRILGCDFKIIYDFRGLVFAESYFKNKSVLRKRILFQFEKFCFRKADIVQSVSHSMKSELQKIFKINRKIYVLPCSTTKVNYSPKSTKTIKFVYIGSLAKWQNFDKIIHIYKNILKEYKDVTLDVFTKDISLAKEKLNNLNLTNIKVTSLPHDELLKQLTNYDFGFLIRDNNLLNKVSSPIKLIEYISNGVKPIMTEAIGDYSELVRENDIGIVLTSDNINLENLLRLKYDKYADDRLFEISTKYIWKNTIKNIPYFQNND